MNNNLDWVSANQMGGQMSGLNAGKTAAPPFGEGQRQSWMLEMERALLAANGVKVAPVAPNANENRASAHSAPSLAPTDRVTDLLAGAGAGDAGNLGNLGNLGSGFDRGFGPIGSASKGLGLAPLGSFNGADALSSASTPSVPGLAGLAAQTSPAAPVVGLGHAGGAPVLGEEGGLPNANPATAHLLEPGKLQTPFATIPTALLLPLQMGQAGQINQISQISQLAQASALLQSATATPIVNPPSALLPESSALPNRLGLSLGDAGDAGDADQEPAQTEQSQNTGPDEHFEAATSQRIAMQETWAKRQLHLYPGADGVQAWIRDTGLNPIEAQAVAQALKQTLQSTGMSLKNLTLNGHPLATWPQADAGTPIAADITTQASTPPFIHYS